LVGPRVKIFDNIVDFEGLFEHPTAELSACSCWRRSQEGEGFHKAAFGVEGSAQVRIDLVGVVGGHVVDRIDNNGLPFEGRTGPRGKEWGEGWIAEGATAEVPIDLETVSRVRRDTATLSRCDVKQRKHDLSHSRGSTIIAYTTSEKSSSQDHMISCRI